MDNRAPSLLPAVRVVEGELFRPDVGLFGALAITISVDIVPAIETTCVRIGGELSGPSGLVSSSSRSRLPCTALGKHTPSDGE